MKVSFSETSFKEFIEQRFSPSFSSQTSQRQFFDQGSFSPMEEKKKSSDSNSCLKTFFYPITSFFKWVKSLFSSSASTSTSVSSKTHSTNKKKSRHSSRSKKASSSGKSKASSSDKTGSTTKKPSRSASATALKLLNASHSLPAFFAYMSANFSNPEQLFKNLATLRTSLAPDNANNFTSFLIREISCFSQNKMPKTFGVELIKEFLSLAGSAKLVEKLILSCESGNYEEFKEASQRIWLRMFKVVPGNQAQLNAQYKKVEPFVKAVFYSEEYPTCGAAERKIQQDFKRRFQKAHAAYITKVKQYFNF